MLGYEVDFGHMEVIKLITGSTLAEKTVGYVAVSVLLNNTDELMTLLINAFREELLKGDELGKCLALSCVANLGGMALSEALGPIVQNLLLDRTSSSMIRKKSSLCLLRLYRSNPDMMVASGSLFVYIFKWMENEWDWCGGIGVVGLVM